MRVFAYIVRDYKSAAEATSLLSSVASLAIICENILKIAEQQPVSERMKSGKF